MAHVGTMNNSFVWLKEDKLENKLMVEEMTELNENESKEHAQNYLEFNVNYVIMQFHKCYPWVLFSFCMIYNFNATESFHYQLFNSSKTFTDAQNYCNTYYNGLATIFDSYDNSEVKQLVKDTGSRVWIGVQYDNGWVYTINGTPIMYDQWQPGEPSHDENGYPSFGDGISEFCVGMERYPLGWNNLNCGRTEFFVCNWITLPPTLSPTTPTSDPTVPSAIPTISPSTAPTQSPTSAPATSEVFGLDRTELGGISVVSLMVFIVMICGFFYYYKYYKIEKKSLYISKGMVILIGISEYDENIHNNEINGYLPNLSGIDEDIKNMVHVFHDKLCYDIYPSEYLDDINKGYAPKQHWTETELNDFLIERAKYLEENIEKYDGLIVIMSCHGTLRNICTSDYSNFSKLAIHRIFSSSHPKSRQIPRLFLFDCCSGDHQEEKRIDNKDDVDKDIAKQIKLEDVAGEGVSGQPWMKGEHNPDYRLAVIEAANPGFQSKLNTKIGSYVIYLFYKKMLENLTNNERKYIHKIFDSIQDELHKRGKQHPTYIWNDDTRYIRFKKNKKDTTNIQMENMDRYHLL
eukprot:250599_1